MNKSDPITAVKGIGDKKANDLKKLGVYTIGDILLHYPRTYYIYKPPVSEEMLYNYVGEKVAIKLILRKSATLKKTKRFDIVLATGYSDNLAIDLVWFRTSYIKNILYTNVPTIFFGKLIEEGGRYKLEQSEVYSVKEYENLCAKPYPIYPITKGVSNKLIITTVRKVLSDIQIDDYLPNSIISDHNLISLSKATSYIHNPPTIDDYYSARRRLAYDEIFRFLLSIRKSVNTKKVKNNFTDIKRDTVDKVISNLPYELTSGQKAALDDVLGDYASDYVSSRLIQGDVGCGKTIVAFLSMLAMVSSGYQAAIMAPTEVLARQHEDNLRALIKEHNLGYEVVCLTGSTKASERRAIQQAISSEGPLFIVGTHALIQDSVVYNNLGLVITDEQHRFGVNQRRTLSSKGNDPFTIVMSATPIPRTLAMIIYMGMNVSLIKDLPRTKLPIKNCVIKENMRGNAYKHIIAEIKKGHQAYIICPLVEAKEITEAENVTDYRDKLKDVLPKDIRVEILHGKMKPAAKNDIMHRFAEGLIDILISTTVVEVGINNPNATTIMIENANRFGLAQLHQLRGRVGRGSYSSYAIFMDSTSGDDINPRLAIMNTSNDGFYIAEQDLKTRGAGDVMGIRQSGDMNFRLADIYGDCDLFAEASSDIDKLCADGFDLDTLGINSEVTTVL